MAFTLDQLTERPSRIAASIIKSVIDLWTACNSLLKGRANGRTPYDRETSLVS